jgi:hypothetical protein
MVIILQQASSMITPIYLTRNYQKQNLKIYNIIFLSFARRYIAWVRPMVWRNSPHIAWRRPKARCCCGNVSVGGRVGSGLTSFGGLVRGFCCWPIRVFISAFCSIFLVHSLIVTFVIAFSFMSFALLSFLCFTLFGCFIFRI